MTESTSKFRVYLMQMQSLKILGRPGALYFIAQTDSEGNANYTYTGNGATGYTLNKTIAELQEDGSIVLSGTDVSSAQGGSAQDKLGNSQIRS